MKDFPRIFLLSLLISALFTSCQEDEKPIDNSSKVIGYWRNIIDLDDNQQMIRSYTFSENGKFQSQTAYIKSDIEELLGYSGRSSGDYTLLNNQLTITATDIYTVPESSENPYVPSISLVYVEEDFSREIEVEITDDKMTWIYPPCGPLENCIGSEVFERYTPIEF